MSLKSDCSDAVPLVNEKKRKAEEMDEDTPFTLNPIDILPKMYKMLREMQETDKLGGGASSRDAQIVRAKDQVEEVHVMKRALDEFSNKLYHQLLDKQKKRIRGLFDSTSPLLSLNKPILKHLIGYLDEEGLGLLTEASTTVQQYFADEAALELEQRRIQQQAPGFFPIPFKGENRKREETAPLNPLERAQIFYRAAAYAVKMEALAASHYNYDQKAVVKTKVARPYAKEKVICDDMEVRCDGCNALDDQSCPGTVVQEHGSSHHVFLRMSYRATEGNKDPLIWQGFVPHENDEFYRCDVDYGSDHDAFERAADEEYKNVVLDLDQIASFMDWPEMVAYMECLDTNRAQRDHLKRIASNLQLTAVLVSHLRPPPRIWDNDPYLHPLKQLTYVLIATGGCDHVRSSRVCFLKPRNKGPHDKTWIKNNVIETRLQVYRGNKLRISIMDDNPCERD